LYKTLVLSSLHAMALMTPRSARISADGLTWARVASAVPLTILALNDLVGWFCAVYVVAAFTDTFAGDVRWFVCLVFTCSIAAKLQLVHHVVGLQQTVDVH
jgi:hypothetical protein